MVRQEQQQKLNVKHVQQESIQKQEQQLVQIVQPDVRQIVLFQQENAQLAKLDIISHRVLVHVQPVQH